MDTNQFKDIFISEVEDHLQMLNDNLLTVENLLKEKKSGKTIDQKKFKEYVDELMRSAHTIKSSAATMGYSKMAFLTHVLEDVFDYVRNGLFEIKEEIINELFKVVDVLQGSLDNIKKSNTEVDVDEYSKKIKNLTGVSTDGTGVSKRSEDGKPIVENVKSESINENAITNLTSETEPEVEKILHIKVPIKRLDDLMDLTEELLIEKMRLDSLMDVKVESVSDITKKAVIDSLRPSVEHLNTLISSLQYLVMQSRLVPAGQIFGRFPRMIRDMSKQAGKEIEFKVFGDDLEMDRSIIDKLGEPLVHLLRNAVDHGIEKDGSIKLEAKRDKDYVSIIVEDDGRGINWSKLVSAAVSRNIITSDKGQEYAGMMSGSPQAIWQPIIEKELLYHSRLSTSEKVTETSGRGVGTSVVKKFVEGIGGEIIVTSPVSSGKGTRFTLNLPLTLAIIKALLVEISGSIFAIPFSSVERAVLLGDADIKSVADQDVAVVDNIEVPLVSLKRIFKLSGKKDNDKDKNISNNKIAVLVQRGNETAGLLVDKLLSEQEIIVKPLPTVLKGVKGFSGSTILGHGDAVLILDVISFLQDTNKLPRI